MSEYQYYEFQAVDRPLTPEQMSELRAYSSRAQITPGSFVNIYNWGDFKGNPDKWMEKYFDAFLYLANWGTRWFMLRLPKKLFSQQVTAPYCAGESFSCHRMVDNVILSFHSDDEDYEWAEGEGWLVSILPTRADLMRGDHRALYLGWLLAVQTGEIDDDTPEPPVPPGLGDLNSSLDRLAYFLRLDLDLIAAAAECCPGEQAASLSKREIDAWVTNLSGKEKDALLARLINGDDPHLAAELRQRSILEIRSGEMPAKGPRRTAGDIISRAEILADARKKKEAAKRAREKARRQREQAEKRKQHLESLAGRESSLWAKVDKLIATRQPKRYDEAVTLLQDLHDLADMQNKCYDFSARIGTLQSNHLRKTTLVERFRKAKLIG
jgi:hypothetical protein